MVRGVRDNIQRICKALGTTKDVKDGMRRLGYARISILGYVWSCRAQVQMGDEKVDAAVRRRAAVAVPVQHGAVVGTISLPRRGRGRRIVDVSRRGVGNSPLRTRDCQLLRSKPTSCAADVKRLKILRRVGINSSSRVLASYLDCYYWPPFKRIQSAHTGEGGNETRDGGAISGKALNAR